MNENPSSETSRPLATSSLAVGLFAAKQGSLCSPRGRLVASLRGAVVKELLAGADEIGSPAAIEAVFCVSICNFFFSVNSFCLNLVFSFGLFPLAAHSLQLYDNW